MPKNILVVDDDPLLCSLLESSLKRAGFDCQITYSGQTALDYIEKALPDLIVLDIMMPDMNGFEVARRIRANTQTANVPIIMLTARIDAASRRAGIDIGVDDYMTKPLSPKQLIDRIHALLGE
ncbi:MAG: response regulator [Anaerolineae bacterium]|nr:response regulator [Anaerolineae bacterium]